MAGLGSVDCGWAWLKLPLLPDWGISELASQSKKKIMSLSQDLDHLCLPEWEVVVPVATSKCFPAASSFL